MNIFEIVLVLAVALVVIGPERFPEVLRAAGKVLGELRAASNEVMRELSEALDEEPAAKPNPAEPPPKPVPPAGQA